MESIIGQMKKIVASIAPIISSPIVFNHITNGLIINTTKTTATIKSLTNYKVKGEFIEDGCQFFLSNTVQVGDVYTFLKEPCKKNDTILYDNKIWYVVDDQKTDVELCITCTSNKMKIQGKDSRGGYEI